MNTDANNTQADALSVTTVEEFVRLTESFDREMLLYRGLADTDWLLDASACRRIKKSGVIPPLDTFKNYIVNLLATAEMRGHREQESRTLSDLELLAELQHHGAATCLIDFTRSPLVALWFACREKPKCDGEVVVMDTAKTGIYLSTVSGKPVPPGLFGIIGPKQFKEIKKAGIVKFLGGKILWKWEPTPRSSRVIAQQSVFVFGKADIKKCNYDVVRVPASAKAGILRSLREKFGVTEESLFGDFTGFALANAQDKHYEQDADDDYRLARALYQQEERKKAKQYCDKAIEKDPGHDDAYQLRGECNALLHNIPHAIADFTRAIEMNDQHAEAFFARGVVYDYSTSEPEKAIADYTKAIEVATSKEGKLSRLDLARAHYRRGILKARQNEHENAIEDLTFVSDLTFVTTTKHGLIEAYLALSNSFRAVGNDDLATKYEKKASELDQNLKNDGTDQDG